MTASLQHTADDALGGEGAGLGGTKAFFADTAAELQRLALSESPLQVARVEALLAAYRAETAHPEPVAHEPLHIAGGAPRDSGRHAVVARLAASPRDDEDTVAYDLDLAEVLVEHLPATRADLASARLLWRAGEIVCAEAQRLAIPYRAEFDARAVELALTTRWSHLRDPLRRLRRELEARPAHAGSSPTRDAASVRQEAA